MKFGRWFLSMPLAQTSPPLPTRLLNHQLQMEFSQRPEAYSLQLARFEIVDWLISRWHQPWIATTILHRHLETALKNDCGDQHLVDLRASILHYEKAEGQKGLTCQTNSQVEDPQVCRRRTAPMKISA